MDIDALRRYISGYRDHKNESRVLSLLVSESIVETYLKANHDVIIDKVFTDPATVNKFTHLGQKYDADIHEFVLTASKELVIKRCEERGYRENGLLTPEKVVKFWGEVQEFIQKRPEATVINIETMNPEEVYNYIADKI